MIISSYQEARAYLESFIQPQRNYTETYSETSLERFTALLALLGNPHTTFRSVQVSGTAGKGSTSYLLAGILTNAGYKTGLSVSPHLQSLTERIQINMCAISEENYVALLNKILPSIQEVEKHFGIPTYLEILMAMVFTYFAQEKVTIAVVEVGLEGKYDTTNILSPLLTIITNIHLDHTDLLGNTEEQIAKEAVSIIQREGQVTVVGQMNESVMDIIRSKAEKTKGKLRVYGEDFKVEMQSVDKSSTCFTFSGSRTCKDIQLSLKGSYQVRNAALAIDAAMQLQAYDFTVSDTAIHNALKYAFFPGRFEEVSYQGRTVILDGAHNPIKITSFLSALAAYYPDKEKVFILSFKKGKLVKNMLREIIPIADTLILTEFHSTLEEKKNASMTIEEVSLQLESMVSTHTRLVIVPSTREALTFAVHNSSKDAVIIVTGSLYLVGDMRKLLEIEDANSQ